MTFSKLKNNIDIVHKYIYKLGIDTLAVTKGVLADEEIVRIYYDKGIRHFGDSRLKNLKKIRQYKLQDISLALIRIPMISEVEDVIEFADISFNTSIETLKALNDIAKEKNIIHKVVIIIEQGDLREGVLSIQAENMTKAISKLKNIDLIGIAGNLTCLSGTIPSKETVVELEKLAYKIKNLCGKKDFLISYGNSSMLDFINLTNISSTGINKQIRVGESVLMGIDTATRLPYKGMFQDAFTLVTEIAEIKCKPSLPWGNIGKDGFGEKHHFRNIGLRTRAILDIGRQDIELKHMFSKDKNIEIVGQTSDHTVVDVTDSDTNYVVGDKIEFNVDYIGMLTLMTSEFVEKAYSE